MSVKERAKQLAASLLEDGQFHRVCAACEKEFGPAPEIEGQPKSHGYCKRHTLGMYKEMGAAPEKIRQIASRPDEHFSPDMAQERQPA